MHLRSPWSQAFLPDAAASFCICVAADTFSLVSYAARCTRILSASELALLSGPADIVSSRISSNCDVLSSIIFSSSISGVSLDFSWGLAFSVVVDFVLFVFSDAGLLCSVAFDSMRAAIVGMRDSDADGRRLPLRETTAAPQSIEMNATANANSANIFLNFMSFIFVIIFVCIPWF